MKIAEKIPASIIQAGASLLAPYVAEINPQTFVRAIESYHPDMASAVSTIEKPLTRQQAASLLNVSLPTVNRLLNRGTLRRIKITAGAVRVDPRSVRNLLSGTATENVSA